MRVKIYGAGSIGNHLANASRKLNWEVDIYDISDEALDRTKNMIYPSRYGKWDENINLFNVKEKLDKSYDLIIVGTPPDTHIGIALKAIEEQPIAILIEKPLSTPDLEGLDELFEKSKKFNVRLFIGFDHVVGLATDHVKELNQKLDFGSLKTIDVSFREHWGGIFNAHPWLSGPKDSYLGYWARGGGSLGEHSHGINLWQYFSHMTGNGRIEYVSAVINYKVIDKMNYDELSLVTFQTETGLVGRLVQDVITFPPIKTANLIYERGRVNWNCAIGKGKDQVEAIDYEGKLVQKDFQKTRPDDFVRELSHIESVIKSCEKSPIDIERGMETMMVIAAAHKSAKENKVIKITYNSGYRLDALK